MNKISNPDVPIEATFKWLVKERNELQRKLDMIVPYTKALEDYARELKGNMEKAEKRAESLARRVNALPQGTVPIKPKNFRKALGHIKQGINMLEAGRYAEDIEELDEAMIQEGEV